MLQVMWEDIWLLSWVGVTICIDTDILIQYFIGNLYLFSWSRQLSSIFQSMGPLNQNYLEYLFKNLGFWALHQQTESQLLLEWVLDINNYIMLSFHILTLRALLTIKSESYCIKTNSIDAPRKAYSTFSWRKDVISALIENEHRLFKS